MRIDDLLREDASCAEQSLLLIRDLHPAHEALDAVLDVYEHLLVRFGESPFERAQAAVSEAFAVSRGLTLRQLHELTQAAPKDDEFLPAYRADLNLSARIAQKFAFQLAYRAFRWGTTDLRRLRLTAAYGYLRTQAEAVGLIALFADDPGMAQRWMSDREDPKKLHREIQPKLKERMKRFDLLVAYDVASSASLHATFAAGVSGSKFSPDTNQVRVDMSDREFNPSDPFNYHLGLAFQLRMQERCMNAVMSICPDLRIEPLDERVQSFSRLVADVWWLLGRRYSDRIAVMHEAVRRLRQPPETATKRGADDTR